jgi:molybdopterin adenylyltransferase
MPGKRLHDTAAEHRKRATLPACVAVVTLSDTRTEDQDQAGRILQGLLEACGHSVPFRKLIPDSPKALRAVLRQLTSRKSVNAIITTGGTGIAASDITIETVRALLDRELPGFNALFVLVSYPKVGSAAMLSRALAGVIKGKLIFCLPGSPRACELAMERLILPELPHMLMLLEH